MSSRAQRPETQLEQLKISAKSQKPTLLFPCTQERGDSARAEAHSHCLRREHARRAPRAQRAPCTRELSDTGPLLEPPSTARGWGRSPEAKGHWAAAAVSEPSY